MESPKELNCDHEHNIEVMSDDIPVLDERTYRPIVKFRIFYFLTQFLIHTLVFGILFNVWSNPYVFFLWHPTMMIIGFYLITQGILQVQSTESIQKRFLGLKIHAALNGLGTLCLIISFIIIQVNKNSLGAAHFTTSHGQLGLCIIIFVLIAALAGSTSAFFPAIYRGRDRAKRAYSPHRILGYWIVIFICINICIALFSNWGLKSIKLQWVIVANIGVYLISLILTLDVRKLK